MLGVRRLCTALVLLGACAIAGEVQMMEPEGGPELGEGRKIKLDLWSHTDGPPMGQKINLAMGDPADNAAVATIVAKKKIERATAGLHHATVMEKQALEHAQQANLADETATTAYKVATVNRNRVDANIKLADKKLNGLTDKKMAMDMKVEEAAAALEMASSADKPKLEKEFQHLKNIQTLNQESLEKAKLASKNAYYARSGANSEQQRTFKARQQAQLDTVMQNVKLAHAKHNMMHARYVDVKLKGLNKIVAAQNEKEVAHKKYKQSKSAIKATKEMLKVVTIGGSMKTSLEKKLKDSESTKAAAKKNWIAATKAVETKQAEVNKAELGWMKQVAYKDVMKTAKLGSQAAKADNDFAAAMTISDKRAKAAAAEALKQDIAKAQKKADTANANVAHMKFAIEKDVKDQKAADDETKNDMEAAAKLVKKQKKEADEDKKAAAGVGTPP